MAEKTGTKSVRKPRAAYHHGDLARALIQASLDIMAEVGAEGLSLREAARKAGVNHRAVYRHYEGKRALLAAIAEGGYRQLTAAALSSATEQVPGGLHGPRRARAALLVVAEVRLKPADHGLRTIGHFGFFRTKMQAPLWPLVSSWIERMSSKPIRAAAS